MFAFSSRMKNDKYIWALIIVFLTFIGAFRTINVGTDTGAWYYYNWVMTTFDPSTWNHFTPFEPGYNLFIAFVKQYISNEYIAVYGLTFIIGFGCISYVMRKYSVNSWFSVLLLYAFCFYFSYMNLMRQTLSMSICYVFIMAYLSRKINLIVYILLIFTISILIHGTAVFFLVIPIFRLLENKRIKKIYLYAILFLCVLIFVKPDLIRSVISLSSSVLSVRYYSYVEWGLQLDSNYSLLEQIMYVCLGLLLVYYNKGDKYKTLLFVYIFAVVLRGMFINVIPIISRVVSLGMISLIIIIPNMTTDITDKKMRLLFIAAILIISLIVFINALEHNYSEVVPYSNVLIS